MSILTKGFYSLEDMKKATEYFFQLRISLICLDKETIKKIITLFPTIQNDLDALVFIVWLSRTQSKCKITGGIKFSQQKLASIQGVHRKTVRVKSFLEKVKENYLPDLQSIDYRFTEGLCTVISQTGLEKIEFWKVMKEMDLTNERVFASTLKKVSEKIKQDKAKEMERVLTFIHWKHEDQTIIANYLNSRPYKLFKGNLIAGNKKSVELDTYNNEETPDYHLKTFLAYSEMEKPFYVYKQRLSDRVFGSELTFMATEVRKALYPNWIDFDLKNCHLAILAHLFDAPLTKQFLVTGKSFWNEIMEYMEIAPEKRVQAKPHVKIALYSLVFGMPKRFAEENLQMALACRGIWWNKKFSNHPIVEEVSQVIKRVKEKIVEDNGMQTAYEWMELLDEVDTVLSCAIQSYETAIIVSCYQLAIREEKANNAEFVIVLHQHDGFSVLLKKGADISKIEKRLQKEVTRKAESLGITIQIERKED